MKKILILCLCFILSSCTVFMTMFMKTKQTVRPKLVLKVYDSETKNPIENVFLYINNIQEFKTDNKGIIKIPKIVLPLGNHHQIPLINSNLVLRKKDYKDMNFNYVEYFQIKSISDIKNRYVSDSILLQRN